MKEIFKIILVVACCLILNSNLQAQKSTNTSGGNALGSGGSVSYSVGQVFFQTFSGTSGSVSEGVQQAFEIFEVEAIEEAEGIKLSVLAFPNPTTDFLTLEIKDFDLSHLSYQLYDIQGKLLQNDNITSNETNINMKNLNPSNYFLKVIKESINVKTFRIVKH